MPVSKPTLTAPPAAPARDQDQATFNSRILGRLEWDATNTTEMQQSVDFVDQESTATETARAEVEQNYQAFTAAARWYASEAAGLAATVDGDTFTITNAEGEFEMYRNDAGSAVLIGTFPTQASLDSYIVDAAAEVALAETARVGAETAQTASETARDAAFVNADVYADIATGLAAVADGEQFQVASGEDLVRYERVDASTESEIARYPSAAKVENSILERHSFMAQKARALDGIALRIHPAFCFSERDPNATTHAAEGGEVRCVKGLDGKYAIVAKSDAEHATLKRDSAGNWYLDGAGANFFMRERANNATYEITEDFSFVYGEIGTSIGLIGWSTSSGFRPGIRKVGADFSGENFELVDGDSTRYDIITGKDYPRSVPHVSSFLIGLTTAKASYNDLAFSDELTISVDWSGLTRTVTFFANTANPASVPSYNGSFYGGILVPGVLSETDARACAIECMGFTVPKDDPAASDGNPVILDFDAGSYEWAGDTRALADLTDNGGGSYTLDYTGWFRQAHTIILDVEADQDAVSYAGTFITLNSGNDSDEIISLSDNNKNRRLRFDGTGFPLDIPFNDPYVTSVEHGNGRRARVAFVVAPGQNVKIGTAAVFETAHPCFPSLPPDSVTINTAITGWTLHRAAFYGEALEGDALYEAMCQPNDVHVQADSFGIFLTPDFDAALWDQIKAGGNPEVITSVNAVGGVAFYEPDGDGHTQRFARAPEHWRKTLVINDGGFEYSRGEVLIRNGVADMIRMLEHGSNVRRYILLEPNPINPIGDNRRDEWITGIGYLRDMTGTHYVETLEAMFAANDGTTADTDQVAIGLWPDSLLSDSTHPSVAGQVIYARAAYAAMVDFGYLPGSTSLPGVPQNVASGSAGVLTWDAPADDGGHPVQGYLVEGDTGSGFAAVATQGGPAGFSKQYIRSMTGLPAGDYRISAITRKGTGSASAAVAVS